MIEINLAIFKNGDHTEPETEFSKWFRKFLYKISHPSGLKDHCGRRKKLTEVKCLGVYCRGKKTFYTWWYGNRLCPSCKHAIAQRIQIRVTDKYGKVAFKDENYSIM